jgi:hypothetical protein
MGDNKLKTSWSQVFNIAKKYKEEHGDFKIDIHDKYMGVYLGYWLINQINNYDGLTDKQKEKLESIGFDWNEESLCTDSISKFDSVWMENFKLLEDYKKENKNLLLSCLEVYKGENLGAWLYRQRVAYAKGNLSESRQTLLTGLGVFLGSWDEDGWNYKYTYAKDYYTKNGNLSVPVGYTVGGFNLYSWIHFQKQKQLRNELSEERVQKLSDIGMKWSKTYADKWKINYEIAKKFHAEFGSLDTVRNQVYDGINLDAWLNNQRRAKRGEKHRNISSEQISLLDELGMKW